VAEFNTIEQQMMTRNLTAEQRMLFNSQMSGAIKDRNTTLILSVLLGGWGVDRFYVGDIGMGLIKLFTLGGCGVIWLIDLFLIRGRADDYNRRKAEEVLAGVHLIGPSPA
jgi:TM2 domain-containing membrane protein YozV